MAEIIYNEQRGAWEYRQMLRSPYVNYFEGRFFITMQAYRNKSAFGAIVGECCVLNELGEAVAAAWRSEEGRVAGLKLGEFVVMPNHFHAIVEYHAAGRSGPAATIESGRQRFVATGPQRPVDSRPAGRYAREPHARDLPYVIGLFKSYTTHLYYQLKAKGRCIDIGQHLWQASFYDELIRSERQYLNTSQYIRHNPANWNSDRFGAVTSYAEGNLALLQSDYVAYLSSEGRSEGLAGGREIPMRCYSAGRSGPAATIVGRSGPAATIAGRSGPAATIESGRQRFVATGPQRPVDSRPTGRPTPPTDTQSPAPPQARPPVISTFTSFYERELLARCLASGRRFIWVCPGGIGPEALARTAAARAAGQALLISPAAPGTGVNKQRANWCNQFIAKNADSIWVGHLRPGGSLETILRDVRG